MKLPNGERAVVDMEKLRGYCLNPYHPRGRNKARVFAAAGLPDRHGQRYVLDFQLVAACGDVTIRSTWIVRADEDVPRLTSCYIL